MKTIKVYYVKSSITRINEHFNNWTTYGVYTSMKKAKQVIVESCEINKGTNLVESTYIKDCFEYLCLSTDKDNCIVRSIIETHELK